MLDENNARLDRPRVAYILSGFPVPSETFVTREVLGLRSCGLDAHVLTFSRPTGDALGVDEIPSQDMKCRIHYVSLRQVFNNCWRWPLLWLKTRELRKAMYYSIPQSRAVLAFARAVTLAYLTRQIGATHIRAHWPYASRLAALVHDICHVPYSVGIHAHEVKTDNEHFPTVFRSASFATFCNEAAMQYLLANLPSEAREKSHLVYHGVDLNTFVPLPFADSDTTVQVLSAGRLTSTKGFDRLIIGCARARARGVNVRLTILGRGPMEAELQTLAANLNFSPYLSMPGWIPYNKMAEHMKHATLFALLADTNYDDGLPNVVLEAMACRRAVVVSPLPAANEAISDGVEGRILRDANDIEGFVDILTELAANPDVLRAMGDAGRRHIEKEFNSQDTIRQLMELVVRNSQGKAFDYV